MESQEEQKPIYRFKKDEPNYYENRKNHLIQITKDRYKNDLEFRNKMKLNSKKQYERLKTALTIFQEIKNKF